MNTTCPRCGHAGRIPDSFAGRTVGCPRCKARFDAPTVSVMHQRISWYYALPIAAASVFLLGVLVSRYINHDAWSDAIAIGFGAVAWSAIFGAAAAVYLLPITIARHRRHRNLPAIAALAILGGWTIILWGAALAWSLYRDERKLA